MRNVIFLSLAILLAGCVTTENEVLTASPQAEPQKRLTSIHLIRNGMSRKNVEDIMGSSLTVGYRSAQEGQTAFEPITIRNPHRNEAFSVNSKSYEAAFYFTQIHKADNNISNEELTPVVFHKDKVAGIGWEYYYELKQPGM